MSLRAKMFGLGLALGLLAIVNVNAFAQQPQTPTSKVPDTEERPRGQEGRGGHHRMFGMLSQLNLTDDQKQKVQEIIQRSEESTKAQRDELQQLREKRRRGMLTQEDEARFAQLHQQLIESNKSAFAEVEAILTPEQKARLEELKKNHEQGFRQNRHGEKGPWQAKPPAEP